MKDLAFLGRSFDQVCFVVPNLEDAVSYWRSTNGVEHWTVAHGLAKKQIEKEYRGQPGDFQFSCAYGFAGETMIELAQHDGGRSVYKDWIDSKGYGLHHVGFRLKDAADYAKAEKHYRELGFEKAMASYFPSPAGNCRWAYFDTRSVTGCYTELYYLDGELPALMGRMRAGETVDLLGELS